jgi:hypothetical protein
MNGTNGTVDEEEFKYLCTRFLLRRQNWNAMISQRCGKVQGNKNCNTTVMEAATMLLPIVTLHYYAQQPNVMKYNPLFHMALSVQKRGLACRTLYMNCMVQRRPTAEVMW